MYRHVACDPGLNFTHGLIDGYLWVELALLRDQNGAGYISAVKLPAIAVASTPLALRPRPRGRTRKHHFEAVKRTMASTESFFRLFMVPGVPHCISRTRRQCLWWSRTTSAPG